MTTQISGRICMYCGARTKRGRRGEHILQEAIGGDLTLKDKSRRVVCPRCNSGVLSDLDRELCSRSLLSLVASQRINAHLWQTWDIDHEFNNLLVEARPSWADDGSLKGFFCFPQIAFERPDKSVIRGDYEECRLFGHESFSRVLRKAVRRCFQRHCAGGKRALHFELVESDVIYSECRLPPRIFTRKSMSELAKNIDDASFVLRYTNQEDKRFALQCLSNLDDSKPFKGWSISLGSHTPTICCNFDPAMVLRALMKIGLNLIAAYCPNTPINQGTFGPAIGVIRGQLPVTIPMLQNNGFVHAKDVEEISGAPDEHCFRLFNVDRMWHVYSSFFGGAIGTYIRLPGPNFEDWNCLDVVAPMRCKEWRETKRSILPYMVRHIEWHNSEKVTPTVKMQKYESRLTAGVVKKR